MMFRPSLLHARSRVLPSHAFLWFTILLAVGASSWIVASEQDDRRAPLDLPSGGRGNDDEDEDEPETIVFYGAEYEGDAFFWCLDKSCSMGWSGGAPLQTLKQEMTEAITSLTRRSEFSIVAFNTGHQAWSPVPRKANLSAKSSAISWVQAMQAAGTTCLTEAGVATVQISNLSSRRHKAIIIVGDGVPECPPPYTAGQGAAVLQDITSANFQRTPIHTIFISASEIGVTLMQQLAAMNNGTFTHIL